MAEATSMTRHDPPAPELRVGDIRVDVRRALPSGVTMNVRANHVVTAAREIVLPVFEGWFATAELVVTLAGVCTGPFAASLAIGEASIGPRVDADVGEITRDFTPFSLEIALPMRALGPHLGPTLSLCLKVGDAASGRAVPLVHVALVPIAGHGPSLVALDLCESTDAMLFGAPDRRLFDLQNPEEGLWTGTGVWRLRVLADWAQPSGATAAGASPVSLPATSARPQVIGPATSYALDPKPSRITHAHASGTGAGDLLVEDTGRRAGAGARSYAELLFDASHPSLASVPDEGLDVPIELVVEHALAFTVHAAALSALLVWSAPLPVRVRDPRPQLKSFQRLSAVGVDLGTASTVAALVSRGYRSLLRLGAPANDAAARTGNDATKSAENPTYLLVEDHERLWAEMARVAESKGARFPNLLRVVRGSHAAYEALADSPSAVVGELKSLPERVMSLDQSPQLRDRERQKDFLLDEARVRALLRTYAYLLGRAINRPGQDVYLHYWLTHPASYDPRVTRLLEEEIRAGLLLSIPEGIDESEVSVSMSASEPEAFAAEVCPDLASLPEVEPLVSKLGELRFCVWDFGGGSLDIACGRFRPATPEEQEQSGSGAVIETMQVSGDDQLGGDVLTHELVWLTHQHEKILPEMEAKEVPMQRPDSVPANSLAPKPHLYKRSLAGRQNRFRFARELGLEEVKFGPGHAPKRVEKVTAARLDGAPVEVESLGADVANLHAKLEAHLAARIEEGVKRMKGMLAIAPWGTSASGLTLEGDWRAQGVVLLLAGNSSRSGFVERALAEELGIPDLKVWRPGSDAGAPFSQVVLWETPARRERGVTIVGVTPKTAVALGALKIANHEVFLVRRSQGFSYFLGDLRGFPPKFHAALTMGAPAGDPDDPKAYVEIGRWDAKVPLRVSKEYVAGKMTSSDPRIVLVPTGLPPGAVGKLSACVVSPEEVALRLDVAGAEPVIVPVNLSKYMR
jgi:hypothetical protein